ncbi:Putative PTS IIA-like nitrogen-regulatory protein PtsN [Hoyosella subflava DQS3-9A1]|uniref:Putative PTS IIA-like nitrogen-regulatory protein PtsN n=1 Tax=Hoyosella subflava (strain DSM 45089 / JCM 17490 / NBRC 109087 / DQS3-9A1) TaxID=443218 RepID=F6EG49_HOYSD|nr:fructose PTS transporter subunit IIA [Hoyosella subflava]AEF38751.1 Putative PTS IIA-like nitrogen-regulatory protein PtsN [Hoyosella subflava DQS3-9A1]
MSELITTALVDLDLQGSERGEATANLVARLAAEGRVTDESGFMTAIRDREAQMPTGIEGGIGIPHARSEYVTEPTLAFGRSANGVDFGSADGPADLIFLIAAPDGGGSEHMKILASLARRLVRESFRSALRGASTPQDVVDLVNKEVLGR